MDVRVLAEASSERDPTHVVTTDGKYAAWVVDRNSIDVCCLGQLSAPALRLCCESQVRAIDAIAIGTARVGGCWRSTAWDSAVHVALLGRVVHCTWQTPACMLCCAGSSDPSRLALNNSNSTVLVSGAR